MVLIEDTVKSYVEPLTKASFWSSVRWLKGTKKVGTRPAALVENLEVIRDTRRFAHGYFSSISPRALITFIDHHPVNATLLETYRRITEAGCIILVEEGIAPYVAERSISSTARIDRRLRTMLKKLLHYGNPEGKGVGRATRPNISIVSNRSAVSPGYAPGAQVIEWPQGPFPEVATDAFMRSLGFEVDELLARFSGSGMLLGQPLAEDGLLTHEEERKYINLVGAAVKETGQAILVKPHPREHKEKVRIYQDAGLSPCWDLASVPAEIVLAAVRPKFVISVCSSAALNYTFRYNGVTVWLGKLVPPYRSDFASLVGCGRETNLSAPSSYGELVGAISQASSLPITPPYCDLARWTDKIRELAEFII